MINKLGWKKIKFFRQNSDEMSEGYVFTVDGKNLEFDTFQPLGWYDIDFEALLNSVTFDECPLLACCSCGDIGCDSVRALVESGPGTISWMIFHFNICGDAETARKNNLGKYTIAKEWAVSHGIPVKEYPPDYNPENTSFKERCNAFYKRNEEMAIDCDFMLLLWTGESSGSFHDILMAEKHHKPYKVCLYDANKNDLAFRRAVSYALENHKEVFSSSQNPRALFSIFKIFVNQALIEQSKSSSYEIEPWWEEGHNSSSYFWVMPVRQGKEGDWGSWGCHCCWEEKWQTR